MKALRQGLIRIARRIGAWLVRRFAKWIATKVLGYMQARIEDWEARKVPPKGRIRRWKAAWKWLAERVTSLRKLASTEYEKLADELVAKGCPEAVAA